MVRKRFISKDTYRIKSETKRQLIDIRVGIKGERDIHNSRAYGRSIWGQRLYSSHAILGNIQYLFTNFGHRHLEDNLICRCFEHYNSMGTTKGKTRKERVGSSLTRTIYLKTVTIIPSRDEVGLVEELDQTPSSGRIE